MALLSGTMLAFLAWLVPFVTRLAAQDGLGRNAAVGIRLPSTTRSERAWVAGHRAALGPSRWVGWLAAGCAVLLTASTLLPQGEAPHPVTIALFVVGYLVIMLGGAIWCGVVAGRAAREAEPGPPDPSR
jgi:hypothetical protein